LKTLKGESGKKSIEASALLNAAYESIEPEIIIPTSLAESIGLWPRLPKGTTIETYKLVGNRELQTHSIRRCMEIQVITPDTISKPVKATVTIIDGEREVLLSDAAISALQIVIEDPKVGIWSFKNEKKSRISEKPQYW
jgi:hypothetical protein